jgi:hypothetical protein
VAQPATDLIEYCPSAPDGIGTAGNGGGWFRRREEAHEVGEFLLSGHRLFRSCAFAVKRLQMPLPLESIRNRRGHF